MWAFLHIVKPIAHVVHGVVGLKTNHKLVLGDVDALALAGLLPLVQRRKAHAEGVEGGGEISGEGHGGHGGDAVHAVHAHCAAESLGNGVVAGTMDILRHAGLTEAGDVGDDKTGIALPENLVGVARLLKAAANRGLNEYVGLFHQAEEGLAALGGAVVHGKTAHIAPVLLPCAALTGDAGRVHYLGVFYPDHVRAVLGVKLAGEGGGDGQTDHDHSQPGKQAEGGDVIVFHTAKLLL